MMAANCERQQQRAENLPLNPAAVQSNGQCDGAEQRTERNRRRHQHRIPKNVPLDFERGHPGVMHRRMPPPTMAPPIDALAGKLGATATAKPTPVRTIAATSESDVNATL
jgi:hypothetical protein